VHLRLGHWDAAERSLTRALSRTVLAGGPRRSEADYHLGIVEWCTGRDPAATERWAALAAKSPMDVWTAKAGALAHAGTDTLPGEGPLVRSMLDPRWPAAETFRAAHDTQWRRPPEAIDDVVARAFDLLLLQQRADGGWYGPRWGGSPESTEDGEPGNALEEALEDVDESAADSTFPNIRTAIAALACEALHDWRELDPARADAALAHGEAFLLREDLVGRGDATAWVYADAFRLRHFAKRFATLKPEDVPLVEDRMQAWRDALLAQQRDLHGVFRHYAAYSSTFVTAMVTSCLWDAREAGLGRIPDEVFASAAEVLEASRDEQTGLYGYLVDHPQVGRSVLGAANRQPLCEWTLFLCGRRDRDALPPALEVFLKHYETSAEKARKTNFHIPALDATAGYFFFHNFLPACRAAVDAGPAGEVLRAELLARLCELPEIDGSFIDSGFSYGKSYSTAVALLSARVLLGDDAGS